MKFNSASALLLLALFTAGAVSGFADEPTCPKSCDEIADATSLIFKSCCPPRTGGEKTEGLSCDVKADQTNPPVFVSTAIDGLTVKKPIEVKKAN